MKLSPSPAPHIRHSQTTRGVMGDAITALFFLYGIAFYLHGPRALTLGAASVLVCLACDILCNLIYNKRHNLRDNSSIVTGMILPLMMPVSISYSIVIIAGVFAIFVAKHPFGGTGHNVFNPAAAGFSFVAISFGRVLFTYPLHGSNLPMFGEFEFTAAASPAFTLGIGGIPPYNTMELLLGNYPGPMGATNILVLTACLLYLVFRGTVRWSAPVAFISTVALLALAFPRSPATGFASVAYELSAGLLLFGGIFLLGDPVTTPKREMAKVSFCITAGIVVMLFRHFGRKEEGITFSLLLMNAAVWGFDMVGERVASKIRRRKFAAIKDKKAEKKAKTRMARVAAGQEPGTGDGA